MSSNPQVTIDIHANTDALRNELDNMSNQIPNNPPQNPPQPQNPPVNPPSTPTPPVNTSQTPVIPPERELQFNNGRYEFMNKSGGTQPTTLNDRMTQDIRREMMSRGVMFVPGSTNYNQLMSAVVNQRKSTALQEIDDTRVERITATQQEYENKRKVEFDKLEEQRKKALGAVTTPEEVDSINSFFDRRKQKLEDRLLIGESKEYAKINQETSEQRDKIEQDLTKAANEILQEMRQGNKNSYIGGLREKYREAIWRRDNAETEEESQAAAAEAAAIQKRMGRATSPINRYGQLIGIMGGVNQVVSTIGRGVDAWRQNSLSQIGEINSAANGDTFGAMQQDLERRRMNSSAWGMGIGTVVGGILGGIGAALSSWGIGTAAGIGGGAVVGGTVGTGIANTIFNWTNAKEEREIKLGQLWQQQEQRIQQYNDISLAYRRNKDLSSRREDWMYELLPVNVNRKSGDNVNYYDLGYTGSQFSNIMAQRVKQRGYISSTSDWDLENYTAKQVALERAYNMSEGSIAQLSAYDRYGNNANQDMANLIASLNNRKVLGMSGGQTLRANEFLGYQTQLMEMQKGWMDAPNANYATRLLLAGQAAFGNNFDSRAISEIGQIENTVTHPKEDYSKALLYDVIQEIMPETKGNLLAIRQAQYSDDPNVRMRIQKSMAKRIQQVYGGLNTTSGYLAASHYYGIEDPVRLRKIIGQYEKGLPTVTKGNVQSDANVLKGYTSPVSKSMLEYQDNTVLEISNQLGRLEDIGNKLLTSFNSMLGELINEFK